MEAAVGAPAAPAALDDRALDALFRTARTHHRWQKRPVPDARLRELYELLRWGPTSANCSPARFAFIRTAEGKARLKEALSAGNVEAAMTAPVVAIVATDQAFYDHLSYLLPQQADARGWFAANAALAEETAFRNGTLQGAYLILAARALGLDAGPMSGFDRAGVDALFFAGTSWRSNFLVCLGYGAPAGLPPRGPRLEFEEAARLE